MKHLENLGTAMGFFKGQDNRMGEGLANGATVDVSAQKIDQSIAYMSEHLNQPLQVAELAALANVSASHYFALFKRRTGRAPIDFFIRLRMRQACRLLCETSLSVKEVAAALGYDDPFYFSRMFKLVVRVAPSEYRLLTRGTDQAEPLRVDSTQARLPARHRIRGLSFSPRKTEAVPAQTKPVVAAPMAPAYAAVGA